MGDLLPALYVRHVHAPVLAPSFPIASHSSSGLRYYVPHEAMSMSSETGTGRHRPLASYCPSPRRVLQELRRPNVCRCCLSPSGFGLGPPLLCSAPLKEPSMRHTRPRSTSPHLPAGHSPPVTLQSPRRSWSALPSLEWLLAHPCWLHTASPHPRPPRDSFLLPATSSSPRSALPLCLQRRRTNQPLVPFLHCPLRLARTRRPPSMRQCYRPRPSNRHSTRRRASPPLPRRGQLPLP